MRVKSIHRLLLVYALVFGGIFLVGCALDIANMEENGDVDRLIRALDDKDISTRIAAAEALGRIGDPAAVEQLIETFRGTWSPELQTAVVVALGQIGDPRAMDVLIEALKEEAFDVRTAAINALIKIGSPSVEPLVTILKTIPPSLYVNDRDDQLVVYGAINALAQIGTPAIDPLIELLKHGDNNYGPARAAEVLDEIDGWQPGDDETRVWYWIAKGQWDQLTTANAHAVEPLIAILLDENWPADYRGSAANTLGQIGDARAVEPLITVLQTDGQTNPDIGNDAVWALGMIGDSRGVEPLIVELQNEDGALRFSAAQSLGRIGDTRAVEPLAAALSDNNQHIQMAAVMALSEFGDERAVEPLIDMLVQYDIIFDQSEIIQALGQIGDDRAVPRLIEIVQETDGFDVDRDAAAKALGQIGDERAVDPLFAALGDENTGVRTSAVDALGLIGEPLLSDLAPSLSALAPVCSQQDGTGLSLQDSVIPDPFYPLIVLDAYGQINEWTPIFLLRLEPSFSKDTLLVACIDQQFVKIETCTYTGSESIERYEHRLGVVLRQSNSGLEIGRTSFYASPSGCPSVRINNTSHGTLYGYVDPIQLENWLVGYIP